MRPIFKHGLFFAAGAFAALVVQAAWGMATVYRAMTTLPASGPISAAVTIRTSQDPHALRPVKDASDLIDRITGLTETDKKKLRDGLASGLITVIRVEGDVAGESRWIEVPATRSRVLIQGSSKASFGPVQLHWERVEKPKPPAQPTR